MESLHNVVNNSIGCQGVDQVKMHDLIFEKVFMQQELEYIKAIRSQGMYRLCPPFDKHAVDPMQWYDMSHKQRDALKQKVFRMVMDEGVDELITRKLSVSLEESRITSVSPSILHSVWTKVEMILSNHQIIDAGKGTYVVIEHGSSQNVQSEDGKLSCKCKHYTNAAGICEHVLALADHLGSLASFLKNFNCRPNNLSKSIFEKRNKKGGKNQE